MRERKRLEGLRPRCVVGSTNFHEGLEDACRLIGSDNFTVPLPNRQKRSIRFLMLVRVRRSLLRLVVAFAMAVAWLFAANHCAFAKTPDGQHDCCGEEAPLPVAGMQMQCGSELNSPLPPTVDVPGPELFALRPLWLAAIVADLPDRVAEDLRDSGRAPPDGPSYFERILSRSLRSHAPPALAS